MGPPGPTEALAEQRELAAQLARSFFTETSVDLAKVERFLELTVALDGWISSGGVLPTQWKR